MKPGLAIAHFQLANALALQGHKGDALKVAEQSRRIALTNGQMELVQKSEQLQKKLRSQ